MLATEELLMGVWCMRTILRLVGDVLVRDTCSLERQANKLSTPWDTRPVQQLVWRLSARFLVRRHGRGVVSERN
jgi:hypothetical protein